MTTLLREPRIGMEATPQRHEGDGRRAAWTVTTKGMTLLPEVSNDLRT